MFKTWSFVPDALFFFLHSPLATRHSPLLPRKLPIYLGCVLALLMPAAARAQQPALQLKIDKVQIGFRGYGPGVIGGPFKAGLWAPLYVTFTQDPEGNLKLPLQKDGTARGQLLAETTDSDDVQNIYSLPFALSGKDQETVLTYARTSGQHSELKLSVEAGNHRFNLPPENFSCVELGEYVYLTLGARTPDVRDALLAMAPDPESGGTRPRHAAYETEAARLPTQWFGYDGIDLLILTTDNDQFLQDLLSEREQTRLQALAGWVRRGGRLLVSVSWRNQDRVHKLLTGPAWQPPLPEVLPPDKQSKLTSLASVQNWAGVRDRPFPASPANPVTVARLQPGKDAEVLIREETDEPLMVRVPYGRGNVTLLAFDLDKGPFSAWKGRVDFWKKLVGGLGPRSGPAQDRKDDVVFHDDRSQDVTTQLQRELDNFDVPIISFGWVALFILLYILVVGPLDYLILKKVFKRLEWTWITFPSVVLLVSVIAYFTAYALKGNDLKINKIDIVDIDLRSSLDEQYRPRQAYAYGTTCFSILSPRIQNYTIGIEPALGAWADVEAPAGKIMVTWLGRPESGPGGLGRQRSQSLFRRAYDYAPDAAGLVGVPIPVWTTKAFTASWEASFPEKKLPFVADLHYQRNHNDPINLNGSIKSNLPADLQEVYLFYGDKYYPLEGGLHGSQSGGEPVQVVVERHHGAGIERWARNTPQQWQPDPWDQGPRRGYNPTPLVKELLFHEWGGGILRNHLFRGLDESWRMHEFPTRPGDVREAILVGRLAQAQGPAEPLTVGPDPRLPTRLWLGALPGGPEPRPALAGTLTQDTYLRVFLPVRPQ